MDEDICPPWWPSWLWWWIRHHPLPKPEPEPPYMKEVRESIEAVLLGLQAYAGALPAGGEAERARVLGQVRELAARDMQVAVQRLAETAAKAS